MCSIATIREITKLQIETTMRYFFTCVKILFMNMSKGNKYCECIKNVSLGYYSWKSKLVEELWGKKRLKLLEKQITYSSHKIQQSHYVFNSRGNKTTIYKRDPQYLLFTKVST